jgi:hypothetical protein
LSIKEKEIKYKRFKEVKEVFWREGRVEGIGQSLEGEGNWLGDDTNLV